ncbi:MOSC domain-containing protein [Cohnella yongneupensis]|uniref:MOSC domain-containing protein n=1 Tax=Cohnella yongneupensis TaxID=425006 RepID=A0ABW0R616_9BACL
MNRITEWPSIPVLSINLGSVQPGLYKGKEQRSGIVKSAIEVDMSVRLSELGLAGDEQADLVNHGGPDKAVCVYSQSHYPYWERVLDRELPHGSFGENFTVSGGLLESDVCVGDTFGIGSAVVQISQPRQPCWKLAMRWGLDELPLLVTESGATGFYFRTLKPGDVRFGDSLQQLSRHPAAMTVAEANRVMHHDKDDADGIRALLAVDALSASWVKTLTARLAKLSE